MSSNLVFLVHTYHRDGMIIKIYYAHLTPEECDSVYCIDDIKSMEVEIPDGLADIQEALNRWSVNAEVTIFDWREKRTPCKG